MIWALTGIGDLYRRDPEAARAELERVIARSSGNLRRACRELRISRRHLYRLIDRDNLWEQVERARELAAAGESWIDRARRALGG